MAIVITTYRTDEKKFLMDLAFEAYSGVVSVHRVYKAVNPDGVEYLFFEYESGMSVMNWTRKQYDEAEKQLHIGDMPIVEETNGLYANVTYAYRK